jgi:predicted N-acetyltransferase YhbS
VGLTGLYGFRKADRLVMPALVFRAEQPEDIAAIEQLIEDALPPIHKAPITSILLWRL